MRSGEATDSRREDIEGLFAPVVGEILHMVTEQNTAVRNKGFIIHVCECKFAALRTMLTLSSDLCSSEVSETPITFTPS